MAAERSAAETAIAREDDRLGAGKDAEFAEKIREVIANRFLAEAKSRRDLGVAQTFREQCEDLALARRQRGKGGVLFAVRRLNAHELQHGGPEKEQFCRATGNPPPCGSP
jgi:hypothetical protein